MSLGEQQAAFQAWLAGGDDLAPSPLIASALVDPAGLSVYQTNYRGSLMGCLAETFPHTLAWLGGEAFEAAAARHIDAHPPTSFTLDAYPHGFAQSLAAMWPDDAEVAELAALEWALAEAFVAGDDVALAPGDLAGLDWARTGLRLVASARIMDFASNAPAIWSALTHASDVPGAEYLETPVSHVVWRADFTCCFRVVPGDEAAILSTLRQPRLFGEICTDLAHAHGEDEAIRMAGAMLARWVTEGLVVAVCA